MSMLLFAWSSSFPVPFVLATGCSTGGTAGPAASCATSAADRPNNGDYLNVVYREGVSFIANEPTSDAEFGAVVGTVRRTIYGSLTPADYEGRDGDATHVRAGDALHQIAERPPSEAVGAYLEGQAYIFVTEQEFRERSAGRCDVPLTRAGPS